MTPRIGPNRARAALRAMAAASLCVVLAAAPPRPALAQDEPVIATVDDILVEGARRVDEATVRTYLVVREGEPATAFQINESVRRLFDTGLFDDVNISRLGNGLLVRVVEAPFVNRVVFEGEDDLDEEQLRGVVRTEPRAAFNRALAEQDAEALLELYRRTGRYGATVEPVIIRRDNNRVDLVFEISEGEPTGIRDIQFIGNERYSDRRLRGEINTKESGLLGFLFSSDIYDPDRLEFDRELLRQFYLDRGHADFEVLSATAELTPDREDFIIAFTVEEGPVYDFGEIEIESALALLDPEALRENLTMTAGDTYSAAEVDDTIENLVFAAGQAGYAFVDIRPRADKNVETQTIDVTFVIAEGPRVFVERIDIEGNSRTVDRVIRRQFDIVEGDPFDRAAVEKARGDIRALGYFSEVDVATERGSAEDRAVVRVRVEEQLTGSISFGVGFSSSDGLLGDLSITERNLLGRGQTLQARVSVTGDEQNYTLSFLEPALLDRDLSAGFALGLREEDRSDESSFEETNIFFRPYTSFPIAPDQRLRVGYEISSDEIRDVRAFASPAIEADAGTEITSAVSAGWTLDRRNDPVEPTGGYRLTVDQDLAGLGGDAYYTRSRASAKAWQGLFDDQVVASLEIEGGALLSFDDGSRVTDRFFLGGDRFRGFERDGLGPRDTSLFNGNTTPPRFRDDALGGDYFAVLRADVSFPLGLPEELGVFGGLFADVGTLWSINQTTYFDDDNNTTITIDDSAKLRASIGASIFVDTPFGPLRFNFAYPLVREDEDREEYFRFTVGTRF